MIQKYAIVENETVTGFCLWDGNTKTWSPWAGAEAVLIHGLIQGECCIGAHWNGQEFTLPNGAVML